MKEGNKMFNMLAVRLELKFDDVNRYVEDKLGDYFEFVGWNRFLTITMYTAVSIVVNLLNILGFIFCNCVLKLLAKIQYSILSILGDIFYLWRKGGIKK